MLRFFKTNKGFSLPEVMIAVAISGVVALGASKLMSDNYKNQAYLETMAEINKSMALAQTAFANKDTCTGFFQLNNITRGTALPVLTGINYVAVNNIKLLEKNVNYGKYSVSDIKVKASPVNARVKDIEFSFDWKYRPFLSTAPITKTISVFAEPMPQSDGVLRATDLWACGGVVEDSKLDSQQALCASLGTDFATWGAPIAGKCNIKTFQCPAGQVPFTVTSLGKVICKDTQDSLDPYALIDYGVPVNCPSSATNIRMVFDTSTQKYRLECSGGCTPVVNGGWTGWSACSGGNQYRSCTSPAPTCGGTVCAGAASQTCGGCTPAVSCATLRANDCPALPDETDSCGTNCGTGTKACGLANGTPCGCTYTNLCSACANAPFNTCASTQGRCGTSITCSPEPSCP